MADPADATYLVAAVYRGDLWTAPYGTTAPLGGLAWRNCGPVPEALADLRLPGFNPASPERITIDSGLAPNKHVWWIAVTDGESTAAHLIETFTYVRGLEYRITVCGLRIDAMEHKTRWHITEGNELPMDRGQVHCGVHLVGAQ